MKNVNNELIYYVDYYIDYNHIATFGFSARSDDESLTEIFARALAKIECLYYKFKKSSCKCFHATLKDKQNNLIFEFLFDFGGIKV